ncbi:MAG: dihydroneopterin triphosphate diphosphatase [Burkholderiaceae bacterium]
MKIPESVLVVIHTQAGEVLLLERADHPGFWQSVTGSLDAPDEPLRATCHREVLEETGIDAPTVAFSDWNQSNRYPILPHWRKRYAPEVTHNTEHLFSLCVERDQAIVLAPREHLGFAWYSWREAVDRCFSMTNVAAIRALPERGLIDHD